VKPVPNATTRRRLLAGAALAGTGLALRMQAARADPAVDNALRQALARFAGGAAPREGRVTLDLPELVENGNAVPITVSVDSPMTAADHVVAIALFTSRNPAPEVAEFRLGPASGRARVASRIRLATSQQVVAAARMADGSVWTRSVDVLVTLAACVES
jgi:sulfur-oxidizing protein SoxY